MLLVIALAGLALLSILSILLGTEDGRESYGPNSDGPATWILLLRR